MGQATPTTGVWREAGSGDYVPPPTVQGGNELECVLGSERPARETTSPPPTVQRCGNQTRVRPGYGYSLLAHSTAS